MSLFWWCLTSSLALLCPLCLAWASSFLSWHEGTLTDWEGTWHMWRTFQKFKRTDVCVGKIRPLRLLRDVSSFDTCRVAIEQGSLPQQPWNATKYLLFGNYPVLNANDLTHWVPLCGLMSKIYYSVTSRTRTHWFKNETLCYNEKHDHFCHAETSKTVTTLSSFIDV